MSAGKSLDALVRRHPLQRLESPSRQASLMLHAAGLISFSLSFKYLVDHPNPANEAYGWHFQYLTIIGLSLAFLTFVLAALADMTRSSYLFLIKNSLLFCAAPLETLISILYWGLRAIDKRLVLPEWDEMDMLADIGFHALPSILLIIDMLFFSPPWTIGTLPAMGLSVVLAFSYWSWIETCYSYNGWYPYPIFEMASTPQRGALFLGSAMLFTLSAVIMKFTYERLNGKAIAGELPGLPKSKHA